MELKKLNDLKELKDILIVNKNLFSAIFNVNFYKESSFIILDLTKKNKELSYIDFSNPKEFSNHINDIIRKTNSGFAIGKYNEDRVIYDHSSLFNNKINESRTIHLGIDLWISADTNVLCPYDGKIHSIKNNIGNGNYGPTIIIEHELSGLTFYTFYGHLSIASLTKRKEGEQIKKGEIIGKVGTYPDNGNWPPHLHFQIISNLLGNKGDFPGVCSKKDRKIYLNNCLDPNLIFDFY